MKERSSQSKGLLGIIAIVILLAVTVYSRVVFYTALQQSVLGSEFEEPGAQIFGANCEYAVGKFDAAPEEILARAQTFMPQPMPLAWYLPLEKRPRINLDQYMLTRCRLDLSQLQTDREAWVGLGRIWGESWVFLGDKLKTYVTDTGDATFPLLPQERSKTAEIHVLSRVNDKSGGVAGFRGFKPLFATDDRNVLTKLAIIDDIEHGYAPVYWLNLYLILALLSGLAWVLGVRYPDVTWFLIATSLYALHWCISFVPSGAVQPWQRTILFILFFASSTALGMFAWTFTRLPRPRYVLESIFVTLVTVYAFSYTMQESSSHLQMILRYMSFWVIVPILVPTIILGLKTSGSIADVKRRTRVRMFLAVCILFLITHIWASSGTVSSENVFPMIAGELLFLVFSSFFIADLVVFHRRYFHEKARRIESEREVERANTVVALTQMIAHDVRRPFSIVKATLSFLRSSNPAQAPKLVAKAAAAVDAALDTANGILSDFTVLGSGNILVLEDIELSTLLDCCLRDVFRDDLKSNIRFEYRFNGGNTLHVDAVKVRRAMTNILENSKHAMNDTGLIWIATHDVEIDGLKYIEVEIGNTGSYITPEVKERIFEPFFTSGKRGGTGLGLAITKKVALAHGGDVTCFSDPSIGTSFTLRLPGGGSYPAAANIPKITLPESSMVLCMDEWGEQELAIIDQAVVTKQKPLKLLVIDDEALYRRHIADLVVSDSDLCESVMTIAASSSEEGLRIIKEPVDIIMIDIDLGINDMGGLALAERIRKLLPKTFICLHSNALPVECSAFVTKLGYAAAIPKPITLRQLHEIIEVVRQAYGFILIIEDDPFIAEAWSHALGSELVKVFKSPEAFFAWLDADGRLTKVRAIISDFYFNTTSLTGIDVALRAQTSLLGVPIILASDSGEISVEEKHKGLFYRVMSKDVTQLTQLINEMQQYHGA